MAPIARRADGEEAIAATAGFLAKRRVHDVGAASRSDWTRRSHRGTRETTGSVRRSIEAVTEGLEVQLQALTSFAAARSLCDRRALTQIAAGYGRCHPCGRTERAHRGEVDDGIWSLYFCDVLLGRIDERKALMKGQLGVTHVPG